MSVWRAFAADSGRGPMQQRHEIHPSWGDQSVDRRGFLTGVAGIAGIAMAAPLGVALTSSSAGASNRALSPLVLSSDLYASPSPQRFVFAIAKGSRFASFGSAKVAFAPPGVNEGTILETALRQEGLPEGRGIYVVQTTFPVPGIYKAAAVHEGQEGAVLHPGEGRSRGADRRQVAPSGPSPTALDPMGVKPICTRSSTCPLHDVSLADVIGNGRPSVVMFATPASCQSQYCGPVLDQLLGVMEPYRAKGAQFSHVEIYTSNRGATRAPTVTEWGLPSEPWIYMVSGDGVIQSRLDGAFSTDEIRQHLDAPRRVIAPARSRTEPLKPIHEAGRH